MRGDTVYRVYGVHEGREKDVYFGAYRTVREAETAIQKLRAREMHGANWAQQHHNKGFVIRTVLVDTDFEVPALPKPRDEYYVRTSKKPNRPGTWDSTIVEVFRRGISARAPGRIATYERNHAMFQTFEPFRQGGRALALISRDYPKTAVLDLGTGEVIAEEVEQFYDGNPQCPGAGFCPVGFYVPDWWDIHDASIIPGSEYWNSEREWPNGSFGFVWGCIWGDDSSWKVQYLDLSRIQEGVITREERFGYVELATAGYRSPALTESLMSSGSLSSPPPFIDIQTGKEPRVTSTVEMRFDLNSGRCLDWERTSEPFE